MLQTDQLAGPGWTAARVVVWAFLVLAVLAGLGFWPILGVMDGTPLGIGIAIVAVAVAFRHGERLQARSERLLRDKLKLQRDTEGLV
ncbi:hypothetical protein [Lacisediminihabitans profunda]|uniref:DUF4229 domain-containing protein n=1 Tax=Lacisediminihabitans profunda TaxID=2594790 RepID=A0A5C8UPK6_9MICO|nr:hypothetical protein [Lacisediminihabitans profunda]TXN30371.1 hypothetical protein FVP33_10205 [Lacisediminihabitans profunda]